MEDTYYEESENEQEKTCKQTFTSDGNHTMEEKLCM